MTSFVAYTLDFNTRGCLFRLLLNISHFQNGDGQRGGISTKVSASPFPPGKECQGNDVATTVSLIPMKITGWQGGCHPRLPRPLTHRQLQVIRARRHAAVVCGNCKLLLKSPGE